MSDDLENFFAKKKAAKKKGKVAQDTDDLAKRLEKAVRQQEQIDRDREEDERRERAQSEQQHAENEDSEWLEAHEPQDVELVATGVQELNIDEIAADEDTVDEEMHEKPKTWNVASDGIVAPATGSEDGKKTPDEEEIVVPKQSEAPKKYVAPGARHAAQTRTDRQPDLQNVEEFPSLAAADELSKVELEKKKKAAQRLKEYNEHQQRLNQDRQEKEPTPSPTPESIPWRRQGQQHDKEPTPTPPPPESTPWRRQARPDQEPTPMPAATPESLPWRRQARPDQQPTSMPAGPATSMSAAPAPAADSGPGPWRRQGQK